MHFSLFLMHKLGEMISGVNTVHNFQIREIQQISMIVSRRGTYFLFIIFSVMPFERTGWDGQTGVRLIQSGPFILITRSKSFV
jgi:hypothetical protein